MAHYNCRVCKSKDRIEIEKALSSGQEFREVAKTFLNQFDCSLHLLEQSLATHFKKHISKNDSTELNPQELELLERFEKGELGFDEMQRQLAVRAFAKILKNPDSIQIRDWLQSELLKIKQQELAERNNWATELMHRMFSGHLPPKKCVKCGHSFIQETPESQSLLN